MYVFVVCIGYLSSNIFSYHKIWIVYDNIIELAIQSNEQHQAESILKFYKQTNKLLDVYETLKLQDLKMSNI